MCVHWRITLHYVDVVISLGELFVSRAHAPMLRVVISLSQMVTDYIDVCMYVLCLALLLAGHTT